MCSFWNVASFVGVDGNIGVVVVDLVGEVSVLSFSNVTSTFIDYLKVINFPHTLFSYVPGHG